MHEQRRLTGDQRIQLERLYDEIRQIAVDRQTQSWRADAACAGIGPERFFASRGDTDKINAAFALCDECPVVTECREYAIRARVRYGMWGGAGASRIKGLSARATGTEWECSQCGNLFVASSRNQRYCSQDCKRAANRVQQRGRVSA